MEYKYCFGLSIKKLNNPTRFLKVHSLYCAESIVHCGLSEKHYTNDISEVLHFFGDTNLVGVDIHNVDKCDVAKIIEVASTNIKILDITYCDFDYSMIEDLVNVESINILHSTTPFRFWNLRNNIKLNSLNVWCHNCKQLECIENLANTSIENLVIRVCDSVPSRYTQTEIGSLKVLADIPNLKNAEVYVVSGSDKVEELLALANLKNIENLKLQKGHFTFEQFAWLKSRLSHIQELKCLYTYKYDDYYNCEAGVIIGKNKPNYYLDKSKKGLDRYISKYNALVQKYKDIDTPPDNYE